MAYQYDSDLEFLGQCKNEDLEVLFNFLSYNRDGQKRLNGKLLDSEEYRLYKENYNKYWRRIAEEFQLYSSGVISNIGSNMINIFNKQKIKKPYLKYDKVLEQKLNNLKIYFEKFFSIELKEDLLFLYAVEKLFEKLSPTEKQDLLLKIGFEVVDLREVSIKSIFEKKIIVDDLKFWKNCKIVAESISRKGPIYIFESDYFVHEIIFILIIAGLRRISKDKNDDTSEKEIKKENIKVAVNENNYKNTQGGFDMFNSKLKEESLKKLEKTLEEYNTLTEKTQKNSFDLLLKRKEAIDIILQIETYVNKLANSPKEFRKKLEEINIELRKFYTAAELKAESIKIDFIGGGIAGAGIMAGMGVAAFMPTVAMGIATTFGTASTGTAIATLSGAAATNAALAWLGGGALAVGGGGMAAGNAFLAMAGPIGWGIGVSTLIGASLYSSNKNREIAEKANLETFRVFKKNREFSLINTEIEQMIEITKKLKLNTENLFDKLNLLNKNNYEDFTEEEQYELGILINMTKGLAESLNKTVKR